ARAQWQGYFRSAPAWLVPLSRPVKLYLLLADGERAVVQLLRHGVQAVREIEVDERRLFVLYLVESGRLLKLAAQIRELFITPYFLQATLFAFGVVPGVVKVQCAGILAAVGFFFGLLRLQSGSLRRFGCG